MTALGAKVGRLPPGRISSSAGEVAGSGPDRLVTVLPTFPAVEALPSWPALCPLSNQCSLKFGSGTQHVQQRSRGRILKVSVKAVGYGDKTDAILLQGDVVQAVHQGPPES